MSQPDRYSTFIRVIKITLPIVALLLVASVFAVTSTTERNAELFIADSDLARLAIGQKITNPNFSGVTERGDAFSITAREALPDAPKPDIIDLLAADSRFNFASGETVSAVADRATLNIRQSSASLTGDVSVIDTRGFQGATEELILNLKEGTVASPGPISGEAPFGSLEAGSMMSKRINDSSDNVFTFQNGVTVIYSPPKSEE